jgi:hypothetical protein
MNSMSYDDSLSIPENQGNRRYSVADKLVTIALLEGDQRVHGGELTPRYTNVSQLLDVPVSTLRKWYAAKDELRQLAKTRQDSFSDYIAQKLEEHSAAIIAELDRRGLASLSNAQLISYLGKSLMFSRIFRGKSTQNVAHQHAFYTPPPQKK